MPGCQPCRTAGVIAESLEASVFLDIKYCNQLRYTDAADACQVPRSEPATAASGNSSRSCPRGFATTLSRKSERRLIAASSKYSCGMVGYVSLSLFRNLFRSLRYSFNRVRVPYSG